MTIRLDWAFIVWATTITFVILKITEVVDWSWWWVFSPLWIVAGILLLVAVVAAPIAFIAWMNERHEKRKRYR